VLQNELVVRQQTFEGCTIVPFTFIGSMRPSASSIAVGPLTWQQGCSTTMAVPIETYPDLPLVA